MVTEFSSSGEEEYPYGEVVGKPFALPVCRYHPARWAPLLPGGGELSYYLRPN